MRVLVFLDGTPADPDVAQIKVDDLGLQRPSLDDVFLALTGHRAEEPTEGTGDADQPDLEGALR